MIKLWEFEEMQGGQYAGMKMIVQTARSAGLKNYGYVIRLEPPYVYEKTGEDIEGFGWWSYLRPRTVVQRFHGWYLRRDVALKRARELTDCANGKHRTATQS